MSPGAAVAVPGLGSVAKALLQHIVRAFHAGDPLREPAYGLDGPIRHDGFATNHADYLTWPDRLIYATRLPRPFAVSVVGTLPYLMGLAIAVPSGFTRHFVRAPAVYLGCLGFALVVGVVNWASARVHRTYEQLRPIFIVRDAVYRELLVRWFKIISNSPRAVASSLGLFLAVLLYVVAARGPVQAPALTLPGTNLLTPEWYLPQHRLACFMILAGYGVMVAVALGTTIRILVLNIVFLLRLGRLPVIPVPTLVRARLRRVVDLHVGVSVMWTVGVGLFGVLFYERYNRFSITVMVLLFMLGTLTFAIPQMVSRKYVNQSYERLCALVLARVYAAFGVSLLEQETPDRQVTDLLPTNLAELAQLTERPKTWVYDAQDIFLWFASQAIAIAAVVAL